jgi:hypothetical protein
MLKANTRSKAITRTAAIPTPIRVRGGARDIAEMAPFSRETAPGGVTMVVASFSVPGDLYWADETVAFAY